MAVARKRRKKRPWSTAPVPTRDERRRLRDDACHVGRKAAIDVGQAVNYLVESKPGHALDNIEAVVGSLEELTVIVKAYVGPADERPAGRRSLKRRR